MELHEKVRTIEGKDALVAFVEALREDLRLRPEEWENATLERYLGALARWLEDSDGYYRNQNRLPPEHPDWSDVAEMLIAAKVYE